ncbi:NAD(+) diphosphatase [Vibrio ostreicida]|uniref:NAD-capped RNA hydrolase NudC n=1 Tax=Vibrio ostreicida TaxID=526588 RepID=A0ABT8BNA0_9VIBR|nr:NAD(+) diphosphatase [Vibrio ostreicida]MDN3608373.1 NAD(+) diphosphatase [Vibrio ostreicida]NPD10842.1 NAD(+) diphosphatase [Vibrio ostreicida]
MLENSDRSHTSAAYWCVMSGNEVWLVDHQLPYGFAQQLALPEMNAIKIGNYQNMPVMWLNAGEIDMVLPMTSLRDCLDFPDSLFLLISKAAQYSHMALTLRFCPICGGRNHLNQTQIAMQCGDCRTLHYPRIFPCIIVAVRKDKQLLLAQHPRHREGMYTVIAGFVEVGETLEQCVAREVREETGIEITNIRYFASQPWAFPSNLMMGFLADYKSGELTPDYRELSDAQWFSVKTMPTVAPKGTIARALIDHTVQEMG